ncbi:GNAT family N-acetyltransferase [Candidatus Fermentibacterales bacterium]|nr:GNAT family N-acetyltransferase [Candidatus Fermentibacterales bacterium]
MSEEPIVLRQYEDAHAAAVARMWEESRDGWPPGFLGATEMTAQSVSREERLSGKLFTMLAFDGERVVGYNRVEPYGGESDAAYVALLNVVTDMHGRKIGKRLLLDGVERVTQAGYYRLDLHTWPANMKAVPLYKKTGFFWVPETTVYMQNYMPFVLGRPELAEFLGEEEWYSAQVRDLGVEPDLMKAPSGRKVFRYAFERRDGARLEVEFDAEGRMLSAWRDPDISVSIEREAEKVYFGVPVRVAVSCSTGSAGRDLTLAPELEVGDTVEEPDGGISMAVNPKPLAVPYTSHDRAPRLTLSVPAGQGRWMELGLGFRAEDLISIETAPIRRPCFGQDRLGLLIRRNADVSSVSIGVSVAGGRRESHEFDLAGTRFQKVEIPLPSLETGPTELGLLPVCDGTEGVETRTVLVAGAFSGAASCQGRRYLVITRGLYSIAVGRRGARVSLLGPGYEDEPMRLASITVPAGPPFWNSDFPYQTYELSLDPDGSGISGRTSWPSRPGWEHRISCRLLEGGIVEAWAEVANGSDRAGKAQFCCSWWWSLSQLLRETTTIPFATGTVSAMHAYNMFPDGDNDFPSRVADLGAPWLVASGRGRSVLGYFPDWDSMANGNLVSEELVLEPAGSFRSPVFRLLATEGGTDSALRAARALGWDVSDREMLVGFPEVRGLPAALAGSSLSVINHAHGQRKIDVTTGGEKAGEGCSHEGSAVEAALDNAGLNILEVAMAGRRIELPVFVASGAAEPMLSKDDDGVLSVENGALSVKMRPSSRGHVFSVVAEGSEYLHACDPGPGEFAWEKPWFGGIRPWLEEEHERPLELERLECEISGMEGALGSLPLKGWETRWKVDDERFGSLVLVWRVGLAPGLPLLHAAVEVEPLAGGTPPRGFAIRANLAPGGGREGVLMTCQRDPSVSVSRDHGGTWLIAGNWARMTGPGGEFVELHRLGSSQIWVEDYAREGCHVGVWEATDACRTVETVWIFGSGSTAQDLSRAFSYGDTSLICRG